MDQNRGTNLGKIDTKIKTIEAKISSTSMALSEEKKLVSEVNALQQLKTVVKDYYQQVKEVTEDRSVLKLQEKLQKVDSLVVDDKENESKYLAELIKLQQSIESLNIEIDKHITKRKEHKASIDQCNTELLKVREKIGQQKEEWKKEKEIQKKKQQEEREQKQKAKEEARNKRSNDRLQKESKQKPFEEDIKICDKLVKTLNDIRKPIKENEEPKKGDIKLNLDTLLYFEQLSLIAPKTFEEIETIVPELQKKREYLMSLQSQLPTVTSSEDDNDKQEDTNTAEIEHQDENESKKEENEEKINEEETQIHEEDK